MILRREHFNAVIFLLLLTIKTIYVSHSLLSWKVFFLEWHLYIQRILFFIYKNCSSCRLLEKHPRIEGMHWKCSAYLLIRQHIRTSLDV